MSLEQYGHDWDAIRDQYSLASEVEKTVKLAKRGNLLEACCPFHTDRTPSFFVYDDGIYHCFGCGAHGDVIDFVAARDRVDIATAVSNLTGKKKPALSEEDRKKRQADIDRKDVQREREKAKILTDTRAFWNKAVSTNGVPHPYCERKNVSGKGAKQDKDNLLLPIYNVDGELMSLQRVGPNIDDKKLFVPKLPVRGGRWLLGEETKRLIICEGYATAATVHDATQEQVCVAYSKDNIRRLVKEFVNKGREVIIGGDADAHIQMQEVADEFGVMLILPDLQGADGKDFNDQASHYGLADVANLFVIAAIPEVDERKIKATPFEWRDEKDIPKREWIYGNHLLRKYLSVDVAAGGVGKSSVKIGEALAMVTGRELYGKKIHEGPYSVWLYNLEDPADETERRIHATAKRFRISPQDIGNRLYADSGRDQPCVIATETATGVQIATPIVDAIIAEIIERKIDVLVIDPFVSSHAVSENDNNRIDTVAKTWAKIADVCNCSINLVHHIRKQNGQEANAESARGAVALIGAARSVMVFNRMSKDEAKNLGVDEAEMRFHFRVDNDKANLAPPGAADWYRMNNQDLDNGDSVGVACMWKPSDPFAGLNVQDLMRVQKIIGEGEWRENSQANSWAGIAIAQALDLDHTDKKVKIRIGRLLKSWIASGHLEEVESEDSKRNKRKFIVVGKWVTE